ncbi:carboxyl-terminal protease [Pirellula staleyi DSM 6068]|uniref:Carboxyl-terminal protease n=1 Tax=Pirellula staleyi (strain ATCC 27377 / DSM 6068 / ICPB 4128) TaxID=530564 RepID=D2R3W3_PIRSD|nr:carboxyl-terminal protease [Pirellula staleyi DSM 6068]
MLGSDVNQPRPTSSLRNWILAGLLLVGLGLVVSGFIASGPAPTTAAENRFVEELSAPRTTDRNVTKVVNAFMKRDHLSQHPLDDEIARRALTLFIKSLDTQKLYFYQTDIDEFAKSRDQIDDQVSTGDISIAYTIFQRLLKRVDERVDMIDALLQENVDFTTDEVLVTDPDKVNYPRTPDEAKDRWRKRLKYDMLVLRADKENKEDVKVRLKRRYTSFARRMHQTDADELLEMYLTAVTMSYDPHTTYMSPNSFENFKIMMRLNLDGIGAQLQSIDGYCVVSKVIPGGAADKSGQLKEEDKIVSVGQGAEGEMIDVIDTKLNDVVDMIRGRAGTIVRLGVLPATGGETKVINITRAKIELTDDSARGVIFEEGKKEDGSPFKIGVIDLPSFYSDMEGNRAGDVDFKSSTRDVKRILNDFNAKGVDALILDLRRNGGGSLSEAISLTGLFIDVGPVVQVKDPDGRVDHHDDVDAGMTWKGPMVVVTSKFSASASEILAGAIQDYKRGLVVGDTSTHGKGTVQSLLDLGPQVFRVNNPPNLGALKITMQQFYRPNGDSTQLRGVLADVVLPSITDHMDVSEADLDYAIAFDKVPSAKFQPYSAVNPDMISALRADSAKRRQASEDFSKLLRNIDRYVEQKTKKEVPLSEKVFQAQREELDADKEEEKTFEQQANGPKEVVKRDFYFNEVMAVTLDYLRLLGQNKTVAQAR